jgi:plastocyanin
MSRLLLLGGAAIGAVVAIVGCSSSSPSDPAYGGGTTADAGGPDVTLADATVKQVNGCTEADFVANDRTAEDAQRIIRGPDGPESAQFSPNCMRVRVGQTVTFTGDLASHPMSYVVTSTLDGGFGDAATAFYLGGDGGHNEDTVRADEPQALAFSCQEHPTTMFGAVDWVPRP